MSEREALLRPIIGIENRTPQEVFDIMCGRIAGAHPAPEVPEGRSPDFLRGYRTAAKDALEWLYHQARVVMNDPHAKQVLYARADDLGRAFKYGPITVPAYTDNEALAELRRLAAPEVPEGLVLVPREPTDAMISAGLDALREHTQIIAIDRDPLFVWRYMLLAAHPRDEEKMG